MNNLSYDDQIKLKRYLREADVGGRPVVKLESRSDARHEVVTLTFENPQPSSGAKAFADFIVQSVYDEVSDYLKTHHRTTGQSFALAVDHDAYMALVNGLDEAYGGTRGKTLRAVKTSFGLVEILRTGQAGMTFRLLVGLPDSKG